MCTLTLLPDFLSNFTFGVLSQLRVCLRFLGFVDYAAHRATIEQYLPARGAVGLIIQALRNCRSPRP